MRLEELREHWESRGSTILTLTSPSGDVCSIVSFDIERHRDVKGRLNPATNGRVKPSHF